MKGFKQLQSPLLPVLFQFLKLRKSSKFLQNRIFFETIILLKRKKDSSPCYSCNNQPTFVN